jgi:hypothetical protein
MKPAPRVPWELADHVSHQLRSPLNGIKVWAQILSDSLDREDEGNARRAVRGIFECVEAQVRVLDDLLAAGVRHSPAGDGSNPDTPEVRMADKKRTENANEHDQQRNRTAEHPQRPEGEPDTMEGPGGRSEGQAEQDAKNQATRRGER